MENPENTDKIQRINGKFAPGFSGNPAGKPKGAKNFTKLVEEALLKIAKTDKGEDIELEKALAEKVIRMALEGNEQMIKLIWNYRDGLPKASIDINKEDDDIWEKLDLLEKKLKDE